MRENFKRAYYRSIPAWFDEETNELFGRNWFYDILININLWLDVNVFQIEEFPIYVEKDQSEEKSIGETKKMSIWQFLKWRKK